MKKNSGRQAVINFIGQHPGCSFQDIRHGTGLDPSVVNSALWQMNRDGRVKREGEYRSYRYTLAEHPATPSIRSALSGNGQSEREKIAYARFAIRDSARHNYLVSLDN